MFVPVVNKDQSPLMPTKPSRAKKWIKSGKATPFWNNGVFCIRLNCNPSTQYKQEICVGVDPGSKKVGFTVKSEDRTYLNVQADAHNKVSTKIEKRRESRRGRSSRKCPNRKNRTNRLANEHAFPQGLGTTGLASDVPYHSCEDIQVDAQRQSSTPLEVGKQWFYAEIKKR